MKIFGVGLQRTGTTSLASMMLQLGFRTCHFALHDEIFDQADAVFDTPVYARYQELDIKYPGAKFILTTRDPDAWLASFKRTICSMKGFNPLRPTSPNYLSYQKVFGTTDVMHNDAQLRLKFIEHEITVKEYFMRRPADLLTLTIDKLSNDEMWAQVCSFVDKEQQGAYPTITNPRHWGSVKHPLKIE